MKWAFLLIDLIIPLICVIFGLNAKKIAAGKINLWVGYRSARSIASREAWEFANRAAGRILFWEGISGLILSLLFGVLAMLYCPLEVQGTVSTFLTLAQAFSLTVAIPVVETKLKKQFD